MLITKIIRRLILPLLLVCRKSVRCLFGCRDSTSQLISFQNIPYRGGNPRFIKRLYQRVLLISVSVQLVYNCSEVTILNSKYTCMESSDSDSLTCTYNDVSVLALQLVGQTVYLILKNGTNTMAGTVKIITRSVKAICTKSEFFT